MQISLIYTILIVCHSLSVVSMKLSPCAKWNSTAITVAGTGKSGNSPHQLAEPKGIFIHKRTNALYVADSTNNRIQKFSLGQSASAGVTVVSTNSNPFYIFVDDDDDGPTIYASLPGARHIQKWVNGTSSGEQVGNVCQACTSVLLDREKNVYMADGLMSCVLKWSPQTKTTTVVAGQCNITGSSNDRLALPTGIYLDRNTSSLYVVDTENQRIQKWLKDAKEGMTVAGLSIMSQPWDAELWEAPQSVSVDDETKVVYLTDIIRNRIRRWLPGGTESDTIAGGNDFGDGLNQLSAPFDLAFDNENNLYVSDMMNHRIQSFALIDNEPCSEMSTINSVVETSPPPTLTTTTTAAAKQPSSTLTTMKNSADSSAWNRHSGVTMIIGILSIAL